MSCPHLKHSVISKNAGGSVIASASYNERKSMFDEVEGKMKYPHTKADDHVFTKMLLPENAPESYLDTERIWNDLNKIEEDRIGYKLIIPFQQELTFEQNVELATNLVNEEFVSKGHPAQISVHKGKNGNDHMHVIAADRRLVNGAWEKQKSDTIYYKRGTVKELDKHGKVINPDAVILTSADKVDTPKLKRKKLQYDRSGNIIMEKGWQVLQYDANGKPQLDKDGYPVLVDIREPDYIPGTKEQKYSKNGKYLKPQWKKDTIKRSTISNIGNVEQIRRTWERLQNEAYQKYNVLDENGKTFHVDLRSYKEQNKELPADQQLIPTRHIGYGMKSESVLNYNEDAKKHNELVKEIRMKARALKAEQDKLARTEKARAAMLQENEKFYALLNPRQAFINSWTSRYNELAAQRKECEETVLQKLEAGQKINADRRKQIDRKTKRGNAAWNRLERHSQLMGKVSTEIQSVKDSSIDVATLAGKKFDSLTNQEVVAFIRARYGYDTATIAAKVLEQTTKDATDALSGREQKPPYFPKKNTNDIKIQQSAKAITGNLDIGAVTKEAFAAWEKTPDEAPPKAVMDVVDAYRTAEDYYNSSLAGHKWSIQRTEKNYNPDGINHDYNTELKTIAAQENKATVQTVLSVAAGLANKKTSAPSTGKILQKDKQKLTAEERKLQEFFGDGVDDTENLGTHRPKTNALHEIGNAVAAFRERPHTMEPAPVPSSAERPADEPATARATEPPWSREKYDKLSAITEKNREAYRNAGMKKIAEMEYQEQVAPYNKYTEIKESVDRHYQKYQEVKNEEEQEAKRKSRFSIWEYEPDQKKIKYYESLYLNAKRQLEKDFPVPPKNPNFNYILWEVKNRYGKMQINRFITETENLQFKNKDTLLENYLASAAERNAYWKKKPADDGAPASGKNTQQAKDTPTLTTGTDRKKGRKPYTGR